MSLHGVLNSSTLRVVAVDPNLPLQCTADPCFCWLVLSTRLASSPIAPSALSVLRAVGRGGASRRLRRSIGVATKSPQPSLQSPKPSLQSPKPSFQRPKPNLRNPKPNRMAREGPGGVSERQTLKAWFPKSEAQPQFSQMGTTRPQQGPGLGCEVFTGLGRESG